MGDLDPPRLRRNPVDSKTYRNKSRRPGQDALEQRIREIWRSRVRLGHRREGLKVPAKQPKKGCLRLNDGSCIRLRPEYRNHVWSYDFIQRLGTRV